MSTDPSVPVTNSLQDLSIKDNPWQDSIAADAVLKGEAPLKTPSPTAVAATQLPPELEGSPTSPTAQAFVAPAPIKPEVASQVLNEFDPLVDKVEQKAHDAWATAESHPPPTVQPEAPKEDVARQGRRAQTPPPPSTSSGFPSFASIARSFSLPRSGTPPATPSPTTLTSLARKADAPANASVPANASIPVPTTPQNASSSAAPKSDGFDFQKFLDQMKTRSAEPVAKYLRSFLSNFSKKPFSVNDQIKLIHDFLNFISARMRECDVWKNASDQEFDNAMEAMEKLVMNRLYDQTFTPQIALTSHHPITTDDLERDHVLSQRIRLFGWIKEEHLDVPIADGNKGFVTFAEQELNKINHYKAPRDKLICILNCCKVIFGLIRHTQKGEGADSFIPLLIFVVLKANPDHLLSNVEYINRFRSPSKLQSEAGYYLTSLMGAVSFIETMDHTSLSNITQEEFEANVEAAIQALPPSPTTERSGSSVSLATPLSPMAGEESARPLLLPSADSATTLAEDTKRFFQRTGDLAQQTISKPLNAIGRIFSEALDGVEEEARRRQDVNHWSNPAQVGQYIDTRTPQPNQQYQQQQQDFYRAQMQTPYKPRIRPSPGGSATSSPTGRLTPEPSPSRTGGMSSLLAPSHSASQSRAATPALDFAAMQAEIDVAHAAAQQAARETLLQIFPDLEPEVADMILEANKMELGPSIEVVLEMAAQT